MAEITRAGAVEAMREAYRNSKFDTAWMDDAEGTREDMATAAALDSLLAYLKANGWTPPMPKEATEEMVAAARHSIKRYNRRMRRSGLYDSGEGLDGQCDVANIVKYQDMIAAAPNPLAEETRDGT